MLKSLKIENFRCFRQFELKKLGRVNLLVGKNNSGKTSILEAIQLLNLPSNPQSLLKIIDHRREYNQRSQGYSKFDLDVCHLFHNHELNIGSSFSIETANNQRITFSKKEYLELETSKSLEGMYINGANEPGHSQGEYLEVDFFFEKNHYRTDLSLDFETCLSSSNVVRYITKMKVNSMTTQLMYSHSFLKTKIVELFDKIVLQPEEELITEALRSIEPSIQRLALVASQQNMPQKLERDFVIKLNNDEKPIPIGSMGDGVWRMLSLALAIVNAKNGILLIDEIDIGLHFSTMSDMWKLIGETAQRLNVQVFATTHNSDCWTSLAELANKENPNDDGITIHRIEKEKSESVVFTERQVAIAAERGIEVR